ncbi:MAG TPA: hypothetical protein VJ692_12925 [Nitrospiraceae bacterium]|nr:hypothetical protein [Nitrospiraceae bacterium]
MWGRAVIKYAKAAVIACTLFAPMPTAWAVDCTVASEQGGMAFPVERLDREARCLIAAVVAHSNTTGVIGPMHTPLDAGFHGYLLDHPVIMAMLLQRLGMEAPQFSPAGPNQFLVDDGDGAQGMLTIIHRNDTHRIYYIDGHHQSHLFPTIRARTVVFMSLAPGGAVADNTGVQTTLVSYTQFEGRVLAGFAQAFGPLVEWAVKRALARQFELTSRLGSVIAQDPDRVQREIASLQALDPAVRQALSAYLQAMPKAGASSAAASIP